MARPKSDTTKKAAKKDTKYYPELEFETASWNFHFWANDLLENNYNDNKFSRLMEKRKPLKAAISVKTGSGNNTSIPMEVFNDEYEIIYNQMGAFVEEMTILKSEVKAIKLFDSTKIVYMHDGKVAYYRPMWLYDDKRNDRDSVRRDIASRKIGIETFCRILAGQLFQLTPRQISNSLAAAKNSNRKEDWPTTTKEQRYVVASIILGSWGSRLSPEQILYALNALKHDGYKAIGLYHIARHMSVKHRDIPIDGVQWELIKGICDNMLNKE